jgi:cytidylate kinase
MIDLKAPATVQSSRRQTSDDQPQHGQQPPRVIITIDGPAGTGKSTMAQRLAQRLGLEILDTGAMYRAAAVIATHHDIDLSNGPAVADALADAAIEFDFNLNPPRLFATRPVRRDLTSLLRTPEATAGASAVAGCRDVRESLVLQQRRIGQQHARLVTEGRDQGSVVFPDADVKFYLDATPIARARRRAEQMAGPTREQKIESLRTEIENRDHADRTRAVGPLVIPTGAHIIDTTDMSEDDVLQLLEDHVRKALPNARLRPAQ